MIGCPKRALILAAGVGRRLRPLTLHQPKGLIEIDGKPLLRHQLESLYEAGVRDLVVVTGYREAQMRAEVSQWHVGFESITWVNNPDYATSNTLTSVHLAMPYLEDEPFLLINGDVWLSTRALAGIATNDAESFLLVDTHVRLDEEAMKVRLDVQGAITSINKTMPVHGAYGESIGVYGFGLTASAQFREHIQGLYDAQQHHLFYEAALAMALDAGLEMRPVHMTPNTWAEVDDAQDLLRARQNARRFVPVPVQNNVEC